MNDSELFKEIDTLPVGPELNALVAEYVMGWMHIDAWHGEPLAKGWDGFWDGEWVRWITIPESDDENRAQPWSPSTNISTAWQIVEKMKSRRCTDREYWVWPAEVQWIDEDKVWECTFIDNKGSGVYATAETAPLAICRSSLKAVIS